MSKLSNLYEQFWAGKKYVRKLSCKSECRLTHPERMVLSHLVYKARNRKGVLIKKVAADLGLDRRTVGAAIKRLMGLGFVEREKRRYRALDPTTVKPDWFAVPRPEGDEWWQRVRTYRHYILEPSSRRSRGNRKGRLSESDNAVLWSLYTFGKGKTELVGQGVSGLASALGISRNTVRAALARLSGAKLVMVRSDGFTLLEPDNSLRSWWRDAETKQAAVTQVQAGDLHVVGGEEGTGLDWIVRLVADKFPGDTEDQRDLLARMMGKCCDQMIAGQVKRKEMQDYWEEVLGSFTLCDPAWDFCAIAWPELWKEAHRTHASNGKYSGSCIRLLAANTRTRLSSPRNNLLSLIGG